MEEIFSEMKNRKEISVEGNLEKITIYWEKKKCLTILLLWAKIYSRFCLRVELSFILNLIYIILLFLNYFFIILILFLKFTINSLIYIINLQYLINGFE